MKPFQNLYPYQKEAIAATTTADKGTICLPTGTGKTYIQAAIVADDILNNPGFRIYVVNAPRILLSYQLLKEFYGFITKCHLDARYMFVHSGGSADETEIEHLREDANKDGANISFSEIESGISVDKIVDMMVKAKSQNLPLVFFSTYNSADKIEIARKRFNTEQKFSIVLSDEAHYLVQEQFHDVLTDLISDRSYFFTATTIHTPSDKGRGMNNVELYGEILYSMTPRSAIDMGKMVRPRLHVVTTEGVYTADDFKKSLPRVIFEAYKQHSCLLSKEIQPKILVSVKGTMDIKKFLSSNEYTVLRSLDVSVYAIACNDEIRNDINGEKVTRQEFLKRLKIDGNNPNKKLIVFHYDTMAEGIDVSGFTAIFPIRSLNKSKFLQTFGRAARLDLIDKQNIEDGLIQVDDLDKMRKPYAYVIISDVIGSDEDDKENIISLIGELRSYGFKPVENIVSVSYVNGIPKVEQLEGLNDIQTRFPNLGFFIETFEANIESIERAKLSKLDFLNAIEI